MPFIEAPTNFYLGRVFDPQNRQLTDEVVYYDSRDLTTHAVVVGMTGSGKTGLCISLLEEAILDNIPAIIIDPKGDICNLALTFPESRPEDFAPWINPDVAQRSGMSLEDYAANTAATWREGLRSWEIVPDRLTWLKHAAKLSIYTPGSDSGLPISILASLQAPRYDWAGQEEAIRERISGVVTALFTLAGKDNISIQDVQHVLVSNIIEYNWRQRHDLTLEDIIIQIKQPPFERLGAFPVDQYFPEKARYKLAVDLNNIIAAPSFQSWMTGEPLDIQNLLYQPNGRPRVSVFYTAHLSDSERLFITTLVLESLIAWMRTQQGTTSLRALLYIDEMYGYFPPYPANPPTKQPIMRLLKQARAYGVGVILATQNPGDLDYKGLSNAGTWFIGRLNSENDRNRVMAGLRSMDGGDALSPDEIERMIGDVPRRVFLMRNVHQEGGPVLVHSRWAMNYLAGPMTRVQIAALMRDQRAALAQQQMVRQQPAWSRIQVGSTAGGPVALATPNLPPPPSFGAPPAPNLPPPPGFSAPANLPPPPGFGAQTAPSYGEYTPTGNTPTQPYAPLPGDSQPLQATGPLMAQSAVPGFIAVRPALPQEISQFFLPATLSHQQAFLNAHQQMSGQALLAYVPVLFAQLQVRYSHRPSQIYFMREYAYHVPEVPTNGLIVWENYQAPVVEQRLIGSEPFGQAIYKQVPPALSDSRRLKSLQSDLVDMVATTARLTVMHHRQFKIWADPNRPPNEFYAQVQQIAKEKADEEGDKVNQKYGAAYDRIVEKIQQQQRYLEANKQELRDRKREQTYTTGEAVLSLFRGHTNYTLTRMSRTSRLSRQTEMDIQQNRQVIGELEYELDNLQQEYTSVMQQTMDKWAKIATDIEEFIITPFKKDVAVSMFGVGWVPHYYSMVNGAPVLVSAFG
jgi:GTPase SAR1 family protein